MGGIVDRFVVRLVVAMTIVSWGSVLAHDLLEPDASDEALQTASAPPEGALPPVTTPTVPSNATPSERAPGGAATPLALRTAA